MNADLCPNCQHPRHLPGTDCTGGVTHGRNFHSCLCLARPGAALACPPQLKCQGGTLGYTDIWYLQHGHTLMGEDGAISPEVLRPDPTRTAPAAVPVPPPADQTAEAERPLSPDYEHPECGFHWHGRDGMDIPVRDGQPVCPRCELRRVEKLLAHRERRCQELREESSRRGKNVLEYGEKNRALEQQIDEVRRQLGAEILRTNHAEAELRRVAAEEQPAETQARPPLHEWFVETRMLDGRWSKYGASRDTAEDGRELFERDTTGSGKGHAFRLVRAITTYVVEAEHTPPTAQPAVGEQPTETPMFGTPDCTCIPFTRQTDPPRILNQPTDTVDMISGWEIGRDCPHHKPAVGEQPETQEARLVELRVRYRVQLRDNDAADWKPSEPRVDYETREAADESAAVSRQHFPNREYRVVTRTTTITEQP
ncbi:MAG: hypothetical protein K0R62_6267 [Nonomuraea muscovyensis]|jgi:hypothetical protein|nr:hypothetical protein [Nonomuraea muscovyensis]